MKFPPLNDMRKSRNPPLNDMRKSRNPPLNDMRKSRNPPHKCDMRVDTETKLVVETSFRACFGPWLDPWFLFEGSQASQLCPFFGILAENR